MSEAAREGAPSKGQSFLSGRAASERRRKHGRSNFFELSRACNRQAAISAATNWSIHAMADRTEMAKQFLQQVMPPQTGGLEAMADTRDDLEGVAERSPATAQEIDAAKSAAAKLAS